MQKIFYTGVLLSVSFFAGGCFGQSKKPESASLCTLQQEVGQGEHQSVRVSGIYGPGLDDTVLEEPSCPREGTWVELDLKSDQNKEKLRNMLQHSRRAYVVLDGDFYGPPVPDPKLPEAIRKSYHPGWGHLAAFKSKLVVHMIREVKAAPTDHAQVERMDTVDPATGDLYLTIPLVATAKPSHAKPSH